MKFEKRIFMGIELDVLVGHPEHELLFVATQVARAAGFQNPAATISDSRKTKHIGYKAVSLGPLIQKFHINVPEEASGKKLRTTTTLMPESVLYAILMRGHAPASEPFRKWVTEEVLPTIRKTGSYNAEESTNPIAMGIMDELKLLRMELKDLKDIVKSGLLAASAPKVVVKSPYEGTTKGTAHYHCDARMIRDAAEVLGLTRPVVDKMVPRVMLRVEARLSTMWTGPELEFETSSTGKKWTVYPTNWLKQQLTREFVRSSLQAIVNEVMAK